MKSLNDDRSLWNQEEKGRMEKLVEPNCCWYWGCCWFWSMSPDQRSNAAPAEA